MHFSCVLAHSTPPARQTPSRMDPAVGSRLTIIRAWLVADLDAHSNNAMAPACLAAGSGNGSAPRSRGSISHAPSELFECTFHQITPGSADWSTKSPYIQRRDLALFKPLRSQFCDGKRRHVPCWARRSIISSKTSHGGIPKRSETVVRHNLDDSTTAKRKTPAPWGLAGVFDP